MKAKALLILPVADLLFVCIEANLKLVLTTGKIVNISRSAMARRVFLMVFLFLELSLNCFSQDYRDAFTGKYICTVMVVEGGNTYWSNGELFVQKSLSDSMQVRIYRTETIYSIATVDTSGQFVVDQNPYGEWGKFFTENDSIYYFINHGSPMGLYDYYYGKKDTDGLDNTPSGDLVFSVYPNPAGKDLYISGVPPGKHVKIKIYDSAGRLCIIQSEQQGNSILRLDIGGLPEGAYVICGENDQAQFISKFVKH